MVKKASNHPKPSKTFQKRPNLPQHVLQRIIDLKNQGNGFIKISKTLKKEGIDLSKSTVANCWYWHRSQSKISANKLQKNPILKNLANTEARLQKKVSQVQAVADARQRIKDLQLRRAATPEGRQEIFKNSEELLEFAHQTLPEYTMKDFELICKEKALPIAKTLSDVVGPLEKYEEENVDMCMWPDLPSYVKEKIDFYFEGEQENKRRQQLQKKFENMVPNTRCPECYATTEKMNLNLLTGKLDCACGSQLEWLCVGCRSPLTFNVRPDTISWSCEKCDATFTLPTVIFSDFTFVSNPE